MPERRSIIDEKEEKEKRLEKILPSEMVANSNQLHQIIQADRIQTSTEIELKRRLEHRQQRGLRGMRMTEKEDLSLPPYLNGSNHLDSSYVHDLLTTMEAHVKDIENRKKTRGEIIGILQRREKNNKDHIKMMIPFVVDSRQNLNDARDHLGT